MSKVQLAAKALEQTIRIMRESGYTPKQISDYINSRKRQLVNKSKRNR